MLTLDKHSCIMILQSSIMMLQLNVDFDVDGETSVVRSLPFNSSCYA